MEELKRELDHMRVFCGLLSFISVVLFVISIIYSTCYRNVCEERDNCLDFVKVMKTYTESLRELGVQNTRIEDYTDNLVIYHDYNTSKDKIRKKIEDFELYVQSYQKDRKHIVLEFNEESKNEYIMRLKNLIQFHKENKDRTLELEKELKKVEQDECK